MIRLLSRRKPAPAPEAAIPVPTCSARVCNAPAPFEVIAADATGLEVRNVCAGHLNEGTAKGWWL